MSDPDTRILGVVGRFVLLLAVAGCASTPFLYPIVYRGDVPGTVEAIEAGADVNAVATDKAWTPLMSAAEHGRAVIARVLLEHGADPEIQSADGITAMYIAAGNGRDGIVGLLLKHGADPDPVPAFGPVKGMTPLAAAAHDGHTSVVRLLAEVGADVNHADAHGWTPLMEASLSGSLETVEYLVSRGASVEARNGEGRTALEIAEGEGRSDVVAYFTAPAERPGVESRPNPTLVQAVKRIDKDTVALLLDDGAVDDNDAALALTTAVRKIVSKRLVSDLGSMRLQFRGEGLGGFPGGAGFGEDRLEGVPPPQREALLEIVTRLLEAGADPNRYRVQGYRRATSAPVVGGKSVRVLSSGSPGTLVTGGQGGRSALGLARLEDDRELAELLERHGAK
jgi:hypothetical protein